MSDYFSVPQTIRARKTRPCIYCSETINAGDRYWRQSGIFEGSWFTSHYHTECLAELDASDEKEFTPYSNERPARGAA